ncbi:MAG: DUF1836 domain-containing protein [Lachnospiraceae bacterium]|nr:DUF1836 domain-containing protein [Lachnospiraceae bacterium]
MTLDYDDLINSIMSSLDRIKFVAPDDIPNIDLYMDQVTGFIDKRLKNTARHQDKDRLLTKTMINNYAKNDLLPPPVRKKYSRQHMLILIFIYYFKNIMSMDDIKSMLNPLTEKYFGKNGDLTIEDIYKEVTEMGMEQQERLKEDVREKYEKAQAAFKDNEDDEDFLQTFAFICMLSFDVYVKKLMIEKIIDGYNEKDPD